MITSHDEDARRDQPVRSSLWRNADFMIIMGGESVSTVGTEMAWLVVPLVGYYLTHSYAEAALAGTASLLGGTATRLPAGALVDRWSRRRVLLTADIAALLVYAALAVGLALQSLTLAELVLGAFLSAIATSFFGAALTAGLRIIVPAQQLPQAMSVSQGQAHAAALIGPPIGGLLYGAALWLPFGANAISYLASLVGISMVRAPLPAPRTEPGSTANLRREIAEGLRFLWSRGFFRALTVSASVINFAVNALFLVLTLKLLKAGVPYAAIGLVFTLGAVGGLAGASVAPLLVKRTPTGLLSVTAGLVVGLMLIPTAFTNEIAVVGAFTGASFFFLPACNAAVIAYQMAITPDRLQARMFSAMNFGTNLLAPLAPLAGGLLLGLLGGEIAMLAMAGLTVGGAIIMVCSRELRTLPAPHRWNVSQQS